MPQDARVFLDGGLRTVSGLVTNVSRKVDVPGRKAWPSAAPSPTAGYRRDQNPQLQLDARDTHGHDRLFAEQESGKRGVERPEFTTALSALQPGDTLVLWKSDRWGRSAAHVLTTINGLARNRINTRLTAGNCDEICRLTASLRVGTVVPSAILRTLQRGPSPSSLARVPWPNSPG